MSHSSFCKGGGVTASLSHLRLSVLNVHHTLVPTHSYLSVFSLSLSSLSSPSSAIEILSSLQNVFQMSPFHQIFYALPPLPATAGLDLSLLFFDVFSLPHAIIIRRQDNGMDKMFGLWNQTSQDSSPSWGNLKQVLYLSVCS